MFNLEEFEFAVYTRQRSSALAMLVDLLRAIERNRGVLGATFEAAAQSTDAIEVLDEHVIGRLTSAITTFATDPEFAPSAQELRLLFHYHGWLGALFAASHFRNADHILRATSLNGSRSKNLEITGLRLRVFCLFYFVESEIPLSPEALWTSAPSLAASLFLSLLAAPFLGTPTAYRKQELLLRWLADHLEELTDLDEVPAGLLHCVAMGSSYADFPEKHSIKRPINKLIRAKLQARGLRDSMRRPLLSATDQKVTVVVVVESFAHTHSIYRTHSVAIEALRSRFHVVGVGFPATVDEVSTAIFDEFHPVEPTADLWRTLEQIQNIASTVNAQILFMPSVGMTALSIFLANIRVAPLMVAGLGHPATTHSTVIDFIAVEADFVGKATCFSECLLLLPEDAFPHRPPAAWQSRHRPRLAQKTNTAGQPLEPTEIAVVATSMKINPRFLSACARVVRESTAPVRMHFFMANAVGLVEVSVRRLIQRFLGESAVFHPPLPYSEYLDALSSCDLFLNPFPFGNTNGLIDTVHAGLVGVCKTGPEVHEHIDAALFGRLQLPDWLIAGNDDEYVAAACRLISDSKLRKQLSDSLAGPGAIEKRSHGRPETLANRLTEVLQAMVARPEHSDRQP